MGRAATGLAGAVEEGTGGEGGEEEDGAEAAREEEQLKPGPGGQGVGVDVERGVKNGGEGKRNPQVSGWERRLRSSPRARRASNSFPLRTRLPDPKSAVPIPCGGWLRAGRRVETGEGVDDVELGRANVDLEGGGGGEEVELGDGAVPQRLAPDPPQRPALRLLQPTTHTLGPSEEGEGPRGRRVWFDPLHPATSSFWGCLPGSFRPSRPGEQNTAKGHKGTTETV